MSVALDSITWTGTFTPTGSSDVGTNTCVVGTTWTDTAGNNAASGLTSSNYVVDTIAPTATSITVGDATLIEGETTTITVVLSETAVGFTNADVTCDNGGVGTLSASGNTYTGTFTPTAETSDASNACIVGTDWTDTLGNSATGITSANYVVDGVDPLVTSIAMTSSTLKVGETTTLTIVFSEAVDAFASSADVTCANGGLATMTTLDQITWAGTFTPTDNKDDNTNVCTVADS